MNSVVSGHIYLGMEIGRGHEGSVGGGKGVVTSKVWELLLYWVVAGQ
jgi:hypothetical protein